MSSIEEPSSPVETENPLLRDSNPLVSNLEQEVLDEYARLLGNVNKVYIYPSYDGNISNSCTRLSRVN